MTAYDDGAFRIEQVTSTKYYQSYDRDGNPLIYSATEGECHYWSRKMLKARQEGCWEGESVVTYSSTVGGKL